MVCAEIAVRSAERIVADILVARLPYKQRSSGYGSMEYPATRLFVAMARQDRSGKPGAASRDCHRLRRNDSCAAAYDRTVMLYPPK